MIVIRAFLSLATFASLSLPMGLGATEAQLPDLVPLEPFGIQLGREDGAPFGAPPTALRFSVGAVNRGSYPLDILGVPESLERSSAWQCTAFVVARACSGREDVGSLSFHWNHRHWHIDEFASYELRRLTSSGAPDFTGDPVSSSQKVSFCLMDTGRDPATEDNDPLSLGVYATCSGALQGISPGWMDVYGRELGGQQLILDGVPDGMYAVVVTLNPSGMLLETDVSNNMSFSTVSIEQGGAVVRALE